MQDRYTGDIGDFGKLGLLRVLQAQGLTIGVNWYLTPDKAITKMESIQNMWMMRGIEIR